jgi:crotonobetainyl-CoA:carnitine CoA-transferase CaiB-like acyl-CoA transferase
VTSTESPSGGQVGRANQRSYSARGGRISSPMPDGTKVAGVGPWNPTLGETPKLPAPQLGEHTAGVLAEFGMRS